MERFWNFQLQREVDLLPLFLNQAFRAVAVSFVSLFSAIYVYKTFFVITGQEKLTLLIVFLYLLGAHVCKFLSNLFAEDLSLKLGLKKQIYFGLFFLILALIALAFSGKWPLLLIFASPLWGLSIGFYWFGRHGLMIKMGQNKAFGKELGMIEVISTILLLAVPFLGGFLINLAGYWALFLISMFFVALAAVAVKPISEIKTHVGTSFPEVLRLFRSHKGILLTYIGNSLVGTISVMILPLYIFLILKKELTLGIFFSLSMGLVALINLLVGRTVDLRGKKELVVGGSILQFFVWLGRSLTQSVGSLFTLDIIDRVGGGMVGIPLTVLSYQKAIDGHSTGRATLFKEIAVSAGEILADCLMIFLVTLGGDFKLIFLMGAIFSLFPILIVREKS